MKSLINAYDKMELLEEKKSLLSGIQITPKRKIGIALSTKIYSALFE